VSAKQLEFSPKQVAKSLEVSESSVKRWCDQGAIPTIKTSGGHRRISLEALHDFLESSSRSLIHPEALGFPTLPSKRMTKIPGKHHPVQAAFREALANGDEPRCANLIKQWQADGWSQSETASDLVTDALHGIGAAWDCGEIDVYQERVACGICLRLIQVLKSQLPAPATDAPLAIGGTLSGDPYDVPSAMVDLTLTEMGWNTLNLGANLPVESFVQASTDRSPILMWLSISVIADESQFVADQTRLANSVADDISLIVGGRALYDTIRPKLRYTAHCDSIGHLAQLAGMIKNRFGGSDTSK